MADEEPTTYRAKTTNPAAKQEGIKLGCVEQFLLCAAGFLALLFILYLTSGWKGVLIVLLAIAILLGGLAVFAYLVVTFIYDHFLRPTQQVITRAIPWAEAILVEPVEAVPPEPINVVPITPSRETPPPPPQPAETDQAARLEGEADASIARLRELIYRESGMPGFDWAQANQRFAEGKESIEQELDAALDKLYGRES